MKIERAFKVYGATESHKEDGRVYLQFPNSQSYRECKEIANEEGIEGFYISCFDSCSSGIYLRKK